MITIASLSLAALLGAATAAAPAAAAPLPPEAAALRQQATDAYKSKRYAEACPLFDRAAKLAGNTAAAADISADSSLCWLKADRAANAILAGLSAAALGDDATRKHAYFNLWKAGRALDRQGSSPSRLADGGAAPSCTVWRADAPGCGGSLAACPYQESSGGSGGTTVYTGIAICPAESDARQFTSLHSAPGCFSMADQVNEQSDCREQDYCHGGEGAECDDALAACQQKNDAQPTQASCAIVFVDPCHGRVGIVCDGVADELSSQHSFSADNVPAPAEKPRARKRSNDSKAKK